MKRHASYDEDDNDSNDDTNHSSDGSTESVAKRLCQVHIQSPMGFEAFFNYLALRSQAKYPQNGVMSLSNPQADLNNNPLFMQLIQNGEFLRHAAAIGNPAVVRYLVLQEGVNAGLADGLGRTPLITAVSGQHTDVVLFLLQFQNSNINAVMFNNRTALNCALGTGNQTIIAALQAKGAQYTTHDHRGKPHPEVTALITDAQTNQNYHPIM